MVRPQNRYQKHKWTSSYKESAMRSLNLQPRTSLVTLLMWPLVVAFLFVGLPATQAMAQSLDEVAPPQRSTPPKKKKVPSKKGKAEKGATEEKAEKTEETKKAKPTKARKKAKTAEKGAEKEKKPVKRTAKKAEAKKAEPKKAAAKKDPATQKAKPKKAAAKKAPAKKGKKAKKKAKKPGVASLSLPNWLRLGPLSSPLPSFSNEAGGRFSVGHLLAHKHVNIPALQPKKGARLYWFPSKALSWKTGSALRPKGSAPQIGYFATYVTTPSYGHLKLKIQSHQRVRIFLNGRYVGQKSSCTPLPRPRVAKKRKTKRKGKKKKAKKKAGSIDVSKLSKQERILYRLTRALEQQNKLLARQQKQLAKQQKLIAKLQKAGQLPPAGFAQATLKLTPGQHLIVLKTLYSPGCVKDWSIKASVHKTAKNNVPKTLQSSNGSYEHFSLNYWAHRKRVIRVSISPAGKHLVQWLYRRLSTGKTEYWSELRRTSDGKLIRSSRSKGAIYHLRWSPDGKYYSYTTFAGRKRTLWLVNRKTGKIRKLLTAPGINAPTWEPKGRFILFSAAKKPKWSKIERIGLKRLRGMNDRWPWYRYRSYIYAVQVKSGALIRLTAGHWGTGGPAIHPKGTHILFLRGKPDYSKRPFSKATLYELNLSTLKSRALIKNLRWVNGVTYSPDGKKVVLMGTADLFGSIGINKALGKKQIPNSYDTQAFIYDLTKKEVKAITKNFAPTIRSAYWHPLDGKIYFSVLDRTRVRLYRYDPNFDTFKMVPTGVDMAYSISFAKQSSRIAFVGMSVDRQSRLYTLDLHNPQLQELYAPAQKWFKRIHFGRIKNWNFVNKQGDVREGRVYYPPGFDPRKRYPVIVYYYGGTYPTTRRFDGSFSFHLWAANGYLVYVLQPSGAVGYGQYHAALHVNEWGSIVADEIINGTKKFLKAHAYANPKSVGCIGASYGGFMTMYILTRTKLFAAAISHAGISNLASYWGGGFWGFLYSSVATANRYPWSHPNFYVKQSPLYSAHKVRTPLLLIHGKSDNNVPPFESYQMYAALRILKRPVEFIEIKGAGHGVHRYKQRMLWIKSILAWFNYQLKKRPLWWHTLHGKHKH